MTLKSSINRGILASCAAAWAAGQTPAAPRAGAVPAAGTPAYQRARRPPARITESKAEPASVRPGQSATLTWSTENPAGVTIEPGVGRVTPRGVQQVSPATTTTYILTVRGPNDQTLTRSVTVNVAGTAPTAETAGGAEAARKEVP